MKRYLLFLIVSFVCSSVSAQFTTDGYYRVKNRDTERYLTVIDDKASVNMYTNEPDLAAILPIRDFERIVGNPASIIYIDNVSGSNYSLTAQGVNTYDLMGVYLRLTKRNDNSYYAYAVVSGVTKYLCDERSNYDEGWLMTGLSERNWYIQPVDKSTDNYFAAIPEFEHDGAYYTTMYANFPYKASHSGIKMFYVDQVKNGQALMKEVANGAVPTGAPVIIQCSSSQHINNKLELVASGASALQNNLLKGVYFNNSNKKHLNRVAYDKNTMRVLGITKEGSLGFVTTELDYLPANKAYLVVPAGSPAEIKLVTAFEPEPEPETQFEIVSANPLNVSADEGNYSIQYTITNPKDNLLVKATTDASWISLSTVTNGANEVKFSVQKNTNTETRTANIVISYDRDYTFIVHQEGAEPEPTPDPNPDPIPDPDPIFSIVSVSSTEFTADGGTCCIQYTIENPKEGLPVKATSNVDWIVATNSSNNTNEFFFNIHANETTEVRKGKIVVSYDKSYEIEITQEGKTIPNGVVEIVTVGKDDVYFDLLGRRVAHPKKGVYINRKGKKVIFK